MKSNEIMVAEKYLVGHVMVGLHKAQIQITQQIYWITRFAQMLIHAANTHLPFIFPLTEGSKYL